MRKHRLVEIGAPVIDSMLSPKCDEKGKLFRGYTSDAPDDMTVIGFSSFDGRTWTYICESEEFEPVPEGDILPLFQPIYTAHYEST